jgi:hypothetical protein
MVCFQTKNHNLGKLWSALDWKMLIYFMGIWNILLRFGNFNGHLVIFVFIWYIFSGFWYRVSRKIWQPCQKIPTYVCTYAVKSTFTISSLESSKHECLRQKLSHPGNVNYQPLLFALAAWHSGHRIRLRNSIRLFRQNIAMLLCINDLICIVCNLKKRNKDTGPKNIFLITKHYYHRTPVTADL